MEDGHRGSAAESNLRISRTAGDVASYGPTDILTDDTATPVSQKTKKPLKGLRRVAHTQRSLAKSLSVGTLPTASVTSTGFDHRGVRKKYKGPPVLERPVSQQLQLLRPSKSAAELNLPRPFPEAARRKRDRPWAGALVRPVEMHILPTRSQQSSQWAGKMKRKELAKRKQPKSNRTVVPPLLPTHHDRRTASPPPPPDKSVLPSRANDVRARSVFGGVAPSDMEPLELPSHVLEEDDFLRLDQSRLPLHLFDDPEQYERRKPQEWLDRTRNGRSPYWDSQAGWQWRACRVLEFKEKPTKGGGVPEVLYKIRFQPKKNGGGAPGPEKWVSRLNLLFERENRQNFRARLASASRAREFTKSVVRLEHFVETLFSEPSLDRAVNQQRIDGPPAEGEVEPLSEMAIANIYERTVAAPSLAKAIKKHVAATKRVGEKRAGYPGEDDGSDASPFSKALLTSIVSEIDESYIDGLRRAILWHRLRHQADLRQQYLTLRLPPMPEPMPVPAFGRLRVWKHQQPMQQETRAFSVRPEAALTSVSAWTIPQRQDGPYGSAYEHHGQHPDETDAIRPVPTEVIDANGNCSAFTNVTLELARRHFSRSKGLLDIVEFLMDMSTRVFSGERSTCLFLNVEVDGLTLEDGSPGGPSGTPLPVPASSLHNFAMLQRKWCAKMEEKLVVDWRSGLLSRLLDDDVAGDFNLLHDTLKSYRTSPLFSLLKMLRLRMALQLQELVLKSCEAWLAMIEKAAGTAGILDLNKSKSSPQVICGTSVSFSKTIFTTELQVNVCADGRAKVVLSPSGDEIMQQLLGPLDRMRECVAEVEVPDHDLLALLELPPTPILDLLGVCEQSNKGIQFAVQDEFVRATNVVLDTTMEKVRCIVQHVLKGPRALAQRYSALAQLWATSARRPEEYAFGFGAIQMDEEGEALPPRTINDYKAEMERWHEAQNEVMALSYDCEVYGLLSVDASKIKSLIAAGASNVVAALKSRIVLGSQDGDQYSGPTDKGVRGHTAFIQGEYVSLLEKIQHRPADEEELCSLNQIIDSSDAVVKELMHQTQCNVHDWIDALDALRCKVDRSDFISAWELLTWPAKVEAAKDQSRYEAEEERVSMMDALAVEKDEFETELEHLSKRADEFKKFENVLEFYTVNNIGQDLLAALEDAQEKAADLQRREALFDFQPTEFFGLDATVADAQPFFDMWSMLADFMANKEEWLTGPFNEMDAGSVQILVEKWWRSSYKLAKNFRGDYDGAAKVATHLRAVTDEFKKNIPLIEALGSAALRLRHWEELGDKLGAEEVRGGAEAMTLQTFLDLNVLDMLDDILEVTVVAEKEHSLERALESMILEWSAIEMEYVEYKETGTYVLKITEDVYTLLDDHIVKSQTMLSSPFIRPIIDKAKDWERQLQDLQALLDEWMACQRTWMYLEPIFGSEDIMRQMPTEGRRFNSVDKLWRKTMSRVTEEPAMLNVLTWDPPVFDSFKGANARLDQIQKGLNDYLETKRLYFPRFFFLSNDELLEILSQTKDPRAVQPHLGKCFEGADKVIFQGDVPMELRKDLGPGKSELTIVEMRSSKNESVPLLSPVDPDSGPMRGNVEMWLLELELSMRLTIKQSVQDAMATYPSTKRTQWIRDWPGMVILCVGQLFWTSEVERAIRSQSTNPTALKTYKELLDNQLMDIVHLVRGKLTKLERVSIGALCVVDVHSRDVTAKMVENGVHDESDFEWASQLRYYWRNHPDEYNRYGENPENMLAKIVNSTQLYAYEYLGNSSRLVITPLTDRCYRTMIGAVALMYGGAPEGPAGTGKTETVKDLSKAVAIQCVVFNCSDGLDYLAMAKFFKGLASSGAWSCFDEFNRIELEVLSVVAQQILTIQKAKRAHLQKFDFEGSVIKLNPDCNTFITMNPGYAGRSELPDNLKALFRPCAMMVPDYAMIAEIKLYSFGFSEARTMSKKLTQVLRLSSEQLSSQKHYDYGMRAVFSILVRAGNLRQLVGHREEWTEDKVVLSAINDVNLPKFTTNDIPLFQGITQDLFPGVTLPLPDYGQLKAAIYSQLQSRNLQPKEEFVRSIVQLYETVAVRHGLMVVGETYAGKTSVISVLAAAMTDCQRVAKEGDTDFGTVNVHTINPKSVTMGQLYGNFDENTHEWADGILAVVYRKCSKDLDPINRHWMVFDGPVDAVWIESMNTVLDDNRKLCLASGEIVKMSPRTTMMFEAEDLQEASPATVSRVGMVYTEPQRLGWRPLAQSWCAALPNHLQPHVKCLSMLFEWLFPPILFFIRKKCSLPVPISELELAASQLRMLRCLLDDAFPPADPHVLATGTPAEAEAAGAAAIKAAAGTNAEKSIESLFIHSLTWSVGATTDTVGRKLYDKFIRKLLQRKMGRNATFLLFLQKTPEYSARFRAASRADKDVAEVSDHDENEALDDRQSMSLPKVEPMRTKANVEIPSEGTVYDWCFVPTTGNKSYQPVKRSELREKCNGPHGQWVRWMDMQAKMHIAKDAPYHSILVPTVDTVRNSWAVDRLVLAGQHVLCSGDTGTGKSVSLAAKLLKELPNTYPAYAPLFLNFSAQTSANQTQDIIDAKTLKRRKGIYGPPMGRTFIVFVDDLNMPTKEIYGAQPPIEILRQLVGQGGWYDRKELRFRKLVDMQLIAAMGPPGGGRTRITQRMVRHLHLIYFVPFDTDSLQTIFRVVLDWFLASYPSSLKSISHSLVAATTDLYSAISDGLRPTPLKSHYTFNLRDLSKVFQGVCTGGGAHLTEKPQLIRLWGHECLRVFADRLVDDSDRMWFANALAETVSKHISGMEWGKVAGSKELIFGNFGDPKAKVMVYEEMKDHGDLRSVVESYLEDYNAMTSAPMRLVMFMNAIAHVARISRVICQPYGNALLVGVGGSGRKSLTTLAASIADYSLFQVEISKVYGMVEWRDDLKRLMMMAGAEGKDTVFLFSDTQIVMETFVEDINNLLNSGEVPNLFEPDELVQIMETPDVVAAVKAQGKNPGAIADVLPVFTQRCRSHLHVVLAFSPVGDAFRRRLRMFPSLVNCCTIDWFTAWPEEALRSVADALLPQRTAEGGEILSDAVKVGVVDVCVDMQLRVSALSKEYLSELRRHYYVTPTSYLELLKCFKGLLFEKRQELGLKRNRYVNGLDKLNETEEQVAGMQEELTALQPKLVIAQGETDAMLVKIGVMQEEAGKTREIVSGEETKCKDQAEEANTMKAECEADLAEAIPALHAAVKALKNLSKSDIVEVKSMKKPPGGVKLTMEACCIFLEVAPVRVPNPDGKGKINDYWIPAQKELLSDPKFLQTLMEFDKDNIKPELIEAITPYAQNADFTVEKVAHSSKAAAGICKWVHAMVLYERVAKVVAPKKEALKVATAQLNEAMEALSVKQEELAKVEAKLASLEVELWETMQKKNDLEKQVTDCKTKLDRAKRLIGGLGGEKKQWTERSNTLKEQLNNAVGDILLASGLIAYLGSFIAKFRARCIQQWSSMLASKEIPYSESFSLAGTLATPVQVREWTIAKLPNDAFSIDNGVMVARSDRWPLMIDPQGQANRWVRNMSGEKLQVCKQSESTFVRTIENCIMLGMPCLLENVPEMLDPVLEPVLLKLVVKSGGTRTIKLGDNTVEYNAAFRFYLTTKLSNPHYSPETCVKINLVNFMATQRGLEDQMLGIVVKKEAPALEVQREELVLADAANKKQLQDIEDKILALLAASEGNILDDESLIETLGQSKITSDTIHVQVAKAAKTQLVIDETRRGYKSVAFQASSLFFCIADLASVDPMYQYSLEWYVNLFSLATDKAPCGKGDVVLSGKSNEEKHDMRLEALKDTFTYVLYSNVCRSLFAKDKLLFSFLLCTKILLGKEESERGHIKARDLRFLLQGSTSMDLARPNPTTAEDVDGSGWLSDKAWSNILALCEYGSKEDLFSLKFIEGFVENLEKWQVAVNASDPGKAIAQLLTGDVDSDVEDLEAVYGGVARALHNGEGMFQNLMLTRCLRPDKVIGEVQRFVSKTMGRQFIEPPPQDLVACYNDSNCAAPLLFVLTPGADPISQLMKLATELGMADKLFAVSLGQGQGPIAEAAIREAVDRGTWVCLQNCHLAESWLGSLERICEEITPERTHPDFRLWLTSMPSQKFPASILQSGVKMTVEPPKGMRANLQSSYLAMEDEWLESSQRPEIFKKMLFGLCFFHATVIERRKFGPLGWNIPYEFSAQDLKISMDQLQIFLNESLSNLTGDFDSAPVPYAALSYLVGECNYGGRVTDDKDRRCILNILSDFYTPDIIEDGYKFSPSGTYYAPSNGQRQVYLEYATSLPLLEGPEVFGLHENANITCALQETNTLLFTALSLQPRTAGSAGRSWDDVVAEVASDIAKRVPALYDIEKVEIAYPVTYNESMNTVLVQELLRFNNLLLVVNKTLKEVQMAIDGLVVLSAELEGLGNSMTDGLVPLMWSAVAYPSLKPLGSWVVDLLARLDFLQKWVDSGPPAVFWISGFFFTQSFLTGTRQNFARKYELPIDTLEFDFQVLLPGMDERTLQSRPPDGAFVHGLFLDGAGWDALNCPTGSGETDLKSIEGVQGGVLCEAKPKELQVPMPCIWLIPKVAEDIPVLDCEQGGTCHSYDCPTYKTSSRFGMLSTTGHSTNFVMFIRLPMNAANHTKHWIKRGVALLTSLDS